MADTNGNITLEAQAQVNDIVQQDAAKNRVAVHTFSPDSTPQQKAASAGKNEDQVKSVKQNGDTSGGRGMYALARIDVASS